MTRPVTLAINGTEHHVQVEPRALLVHVLRDELDLTGTHIGCDTSQCGACTVLLDGQRREELHGPRGPGRGAVTTIEGLGKRATPPAAAGVLGQARTPVRLLHPGHDHDRDWTCCASNPDPTEEEIRHALEGNYCRCTGYQNIVARDPGAPRLSDPPPPPV